MSDSSRIAELERRLEWFTKVLMCRFDPNSAPREGEALYGVRYVALDGIAEPKLKTTPFVPHFLRKQYTVHLPFTFLQLPSYLHCLGCGCVQKDNSKCEMCGSDELDPIYILTV